MATAGPADAWRPSGGRPDESPAAARAPHPDRGPGHDRAPRPTWAGTPRRPRPDEAYRHGEGKLRGFAAVLGIFLLTLAGAGIDSLVGIGLGPFTLATLVGSTLLGAAVVRRRDLTSVVVAPPLVFVAVAGVHIALTPTASFTVATIAVVLVQGFPAMAIATGVALLVGLVRLVARRQALRGVRR